MDGLATWLAVAGLGALHGLGPSSGWVLAAANEVRDGEGTAARRALLPVATGHLAAIGATAGAFAVGVALDRGLAQLVAGMALVIVAALRALRSDREASPPGHFRLAGLGAWCFVSSSAPGAGLMLGPAMGSLCVSAGATAGASAAAALAAGVAALAVHTAAMLTTAWIAAAGVCRSLARLRGVASDATRRYAPVAMLAVAGVLLMAQARS